MLHRNISLLCRIAKVSSSGYYKWLLSSEEQEKDYDDFLLIKTVFDKGKGKYGSRTIKMKLEKDKIRMNLKKIQRIMKKYGLITIIRRKNPYKMIMKKTAEHRTAPNILSRHFTQTVPYKAFSTDITYLWWNHRFVYLSVIKDLATGEIVAWKISRRLEMSLVMETVEKLSRNESISNFEDILIHSDQGFHYTNPLYIQKVKEMKMSQSMSRKGNCIDNSPIESFFGHMKDDLDYKSCKTFDELSFHVDEYMAYYNNERQQWERKKMTPVEYRNHLLKIDK